MPRRKRRRVCTMCGTTEDVNDRSWLCFPCAMEKHQDAIRQIREKKGPVYEKWAAGLLKHLREVAETG